MTRARKDRDATINPRMRISAVQWRTVKVYPSRRGASNAKVIATSPSGVARGKLMNAVIRAATAVTTERTEVQMIERRNR